MARELFIEAAPTKGQCAKPYFYGRDGEIERALQKPEGEYAEIMRRIFDDPHAATRVDIATLHDFMLLQSYRSAAWIEGEIRQAEAERAILADEATPELLERLVMPHQVAIKLALRAFSNSIESTAHLQTRIFLNRTAMPFITSDDPVIFTNRFHLQKGVLGGAGIASPGAMLLMPLAPHLLLLSFDPTIYRFDGRSKELGIVDRTSDVAAFNDLQAVRGHANLYFRHWNDRAWVASTYEKAKPRRRQTWLDVEILQETEAGTNTFVAVTGRRVHYPERRELLHTRRNVPAPAAWPSLLTYTEHARRARRGVDQSSLWD